MDALKSKLSELELLTAGKKVNLQIRLIEHFGLEDHEGSDNDFSSTVHEPAKLLIVFLHCEIF